MRHAAIAGATLALLAAPAWAANYYVDTQNPAASDGNPGTQALPFKTISGAAAAQNGAGKTIIVMPGTYRETVTVPASGTASSYYVFQTSGPGVIVDGADDFSGTSKWNLYSGSVYLASSVNWSPKQVFVNGVRLTPSSASPSALPVNSFRYVSSAGLYVNLGSGINPGTRATRVGRRAYGFRLSGRSYVMIRGFTITAHEDRGVYLSSNANNCIVRSNQVTWFYKYGIQWSSCDGGIIDSNFVSDGQDHGINLSSSDGVTVQDNESCRHLLPGTRAANGLYLNRASNNLIQRNRFHDNQDSGSNLGTACDDNLEIQNISWNNGDHGFDHLNASGNVLIGCVAYGNYKDGFSIEGGSPGCKVYDCIAVNNGLTTDEFNLWVDSQSSVGFQSDYNLFWNSTSQAPVKFISTQYFSVATYAASTGNDTHTLQANPQFVNPAAGDFHLQSTSPAIDAAKSDAPNWPATDAEGRARQDLPAVPNTGVGPVPYAERGALEYFIAGNQPPVVTAPASVSVNENQLLTVDVSVTDPNGDPITSLTASGTPPGATFTAGPGNTSGTLTWTPGYAQAGPYSVTFTASNALTGTATTSITVNNVDRAPIVTAQATASVNENQPLTVDVTAADPDGESITSLTPSALPAGASFAAGPGNTSGTLTWTPGYAQAGSYSVTFTASNALSGTATTVITVNNVDRAPTVAAQATASVNENQLLTVNVTAADPDGEAITSLTPSALPAGASFTAGPGNTSGTLTWTPTFAQAGSYSVTFTATNALSGTATTAITVDNVDRPPVVVAPAGAVVLEGEALTVDITASDPDGDAITSLTPTGVPAGASFTVGSGNTSGTLTWTPPIGAAGSYPVTFTASNALSGDATTDLTVTQDAHAPVVVAPATRQIRALQTLTFQVTASDPDGQPIASLSASGMPAEAGFAPVADNSSGTFSWTPTAGDQGDHVVTFTASNTQNGFASTTITVQPPDQAPVVNAQATASIDENQLLTVNVTASDPDADAITSLTASGTPPGAVFTSGSGNLTGTLSWTPSYSQAGPYTVTFTATNALSGSATTSITVNNVDRPPVVVAPASRTVRVAELLSVAVTASDPDGDAIADMAMTGLPAGASFTADPGNTGGTLTWTPGVGDAGPHTATFTATNALSGSATTSITVDDADRPPVVTAPATASGQVGVPMVVDVSASDPDGTPITSLSVSPLAGATFTPGPDNTSGSLSWTPAAGDVGDHTVTFTASNALSGSATTTISVIPANQPPVAALSVTPATGNAPLTVTADAAGSSDPDSPIASYTFNFGDGFTVGPQATPSASHPLAAGTWSVSVTVTDNLGASSSASASVLVAAVPPEPNLVGNPSFETNTNNWNAYGVATLTRVAGGFDGSWALQMVGGSTTASFGCNDSPNWIGSVASAGQRYRFTAWVRSFSSTGIAKIQVREYAGSTRLGQLYSPGVTLSPQWQMVTVDYVTTSGGVTLDLQVLDAPLVGGETFITDNISIRNITGSVEAVMAEGGVGEQASVVDPLADSGPGFGVPNRAPLQATVSPNPLHSHSLITFVTTRSGPLQVAIYDAGGRRVRDLQSSTAPAGLQRIFVDGRNDQGEPLRPGLYFYRIRAVEGSSAGRFVVAR